MLNTNITAVVERLEAEASWNGRIDLFRDKFGGDEVKNDSYYANGNLFWQGENGLIVHLKGDCRGSHGFPPLVFGSGKVPTHHYSVLSEVSFETGMKFSYDRYPLFLESSLEQGASFSSYEWDKVEQEHAEKHTVFLKNMRELIRIERGRGIDVPDLMDPKGNVKSAVHRDETEHLYTVVLNQSRALPYELMQNSNPKEIFFCAMKTDCLR